MAETTHVNNIIASNAKQRLSESDPSPRDNNLLIIAGGCSGFEPNTELITQASIGTVAAALQLQRGGGGLIYLIIMIFLIFPLVIVQRLILFKECSLLIRVYP